MVSWGNISKIGFGSYRINDSSQEHYDALCHAFKCGCNLIDTSSNYTDGRSEMLIGKFINSNPQYQPFIITKAGYIQGSNLRDFNEQHYPDFNAADVVCINDDFKHCIHPAFLENQIQQSLTRLKVKQIDAFLLHNPEYFFMGAFAQNKEVFYEQIKRAFIFLECMVANGKIRSYGISSNTFSCSDEMPNSVLLTRALSIAREIKKEHNFKAIQFPFNILEQQAAKMHGDAPALINLAKENNIRTFSNRPLNANSPEGPVRLAIYPDEAIFSEEQSQQLWNNCLSLINRQLNTIYDNADAMTIELVRFLSINWANFDNIEFASNFFDGSFFPFLTRIYSDHIPKEQKEIYLSFKRAVTDITLKNMQNKTLLFRERMVRKGLIQDDKNTSLPVLACQYYLNAGIDHVLVGMRTTKYVDDLKKLF